MTLLSTSPLLTQTRRLFLVSPSLSSLHGLPFVPLELLQRRKRLESVSITVILDKWWTHGRIFMLSKFYTHRDSLFLLHCFLVYWKIFPQYVVIMFSLALILIVVIRWNVNRKGIIFRKEFLKKFILILQKSTISILWKLHRTPEAGFLCVPLTVL